MASMVKIRPPVLPAPSNHLLLLPRALFDTHSCLLTYLLENLAFLETNSPAACGNIRFIIPAPTLALYNLSKEGLTWSPACLLLASTPGIPQAAHQLAPRFLTLHTNKTVENHHDSSYNSYSPLGQLLTPYFPLWQSSGVWSCSAADTLPIKSLHYSIFVSKHKKPAKCAQSLLIEPVFCKNMTI